MLHWEDALKFPRIFEDFRSLFPEFGAETTENSPNVTTIFHCRILGKSVKNLATCLKSRLSKACGWCHGGLHSLKAGDPPKQSFCTGLTVPIFPLSKQLNSLRNHPMTEQHEHYINNCGFHSQLLGNIFLKPWIFLEDLARPKSIQNVKYINRSYIWWDNFVLKGK